ncbi:MAG: hypothetical protein WKF94_17140 [Solirubrobacteraceae bacterium]
MKSNLPTAPRRFAVLPLAKRPSTDRSAVRRYIIVPATRAPVAGVRSP